MSVTNRRVFMMQVVVCGSALAATRVMAAAPMVAEADDNAVKLGYKADATKVDAKKYPAHKPTQACGNCALFQGKPGDADGPCPLFTIAATGNKHVSAKAWCSAYAAKG